jgi:hypothetical protein
VVYLMALGNTVILRSSRRGVSKDAAQLTQL